MLAIAAQPTFAADWEVTAAEVVTALEQTFGVHPGERRNHIKGTCAVGDFVGTTDAAPYTRSPLFSGSPIPVIARFSLAGGNPNVPDTTKNARGMVLEFRLPDGQRQHMTMLNTPVFGAATPKSFLDMIVAMRPDPATGKPDPARISAYKARHPDNLAQAQFLDRNNPPVSYANSAYLRNPHLQVRQQRQQGDARALGIPAARWRETAIGRRAEDRRSELPRGSADQANATVVRSLGHGYRHWPTRRSGEQSHAGVAGQRLKVNVGTLTIRNAMPQKGTECERINYDPMVMADGIAATDDPVLRFRSAAYAVSFAKRMGDR